MTPRTHTTGINHLLSSVASKNAIKNNHIPPNPNQPAPGKHTVVTPWVSIHFRSPDPQGRENPSIDHDPRGSNRHRPEDARLDRRLWPFFLENFLLRSPLQARKGPGLLGSKQQKQYPLSRKTDRVCKKSRPEKLSHSAQHPQTPTIVYVGSGSGRKPPIELGRSVYITDRPP